MKSEERENVFKIIREQEAERNSLLASFVKPTKIEIPSYSLAQIAFSVIEQSTFKASSLAPYEIDYSIFNVPKLSFPEIEFPEFDIDYERIETITNDNSKYGWTLTGEMSTGDYLEDDLIDVSPKEKDKYFYAYYSKNDWEHFGYMKKEILENIESRWTELIQDCFDSFENDKYKLAIPTLFTIIEGEMSFVFHSHEGSNAIIKLMGTKAENEESKMKQISLYSVVHSMKDQLFGSLSFAEDRNDLINRHRVLHGRDDPSQWQKVDALRLINIISSLQFIKGVLNKE